jgi:hypothetical protein
MAAFVFLMILISKIIGLGVPELLTTSCEIASP